STIQSGTASRPSKARTMRSSSRTTNAQRSLRISSWPLNFASGDVMTTPAERRFQKMRAATVAAASGPGESLAGASSYELMLAKLDNDRRRLREIQSIERKIEVKRELLPDYDAWVSGTLEGGRGAQDDVLTSIMMWHIDTGHYDLALNIAEYVLK